MNSEFVLLLICKLPEHHDLQESSREYWTGKHDEWASQFEDGEIRNVPTLWARETHA